MLPTKKDSDGHTAAGVKHNGRLFQIFTLLCGYLTKGVIEMDPISGLRGGGRAAMGPNGDRLVLKYTGYCLSVGKQSRHWRSRRTNFVEPPHPT